MQNPEAPVEEAAPAGELGNAGEMSFEDAMRLAVQTAQGVEPTEEPEPPAESVQDETPVEAAPETPEPAEAVETPPEEPQEDRSLARIMERESKLAEKQAAYDAAQDELNDLRSRLDRFEGTQSTFAADPISYIRSLAPDMDLKRLAEGLWNEHLGEKAPAEYLQKKAATRQYSEQGARLAKLEQRDQEREQRAQQESAQRGLQQYLGSLSSFAESADTGNFPLVAGLNQKSPQVVAGAMERIARTHARQTNGQVLTPEQVGQALEKELAIYQLSAPPVNEPTPAPAQGTSLRNSSNQVQPDRVAEDELSDEFLHEQAMKAAREAAGL